jgi:hypothetical protein
VLGPPPSATGARASVSGASDAAWCGRRGAPIEGQPRWTRRTGDRGAARGAEEPADDEALILQVGTLLERAAEAVVDDESLRAATSGAEFEEAVALLTASRLPDARLLHEASRDSWFPACAKLAAVARRPRNPGLVDAVLGRLDRHAPVELPFVLGVLEAHADGPLVERSSAAGPRVGRVAVRRHGGPRSRRVAPGGGRGADPARLLDLLGDTAPPWLPAVLDDLRFVLPTPSWSLSRQASSAVPRVGSCATSAASTSVQARCRTRPPCS